MSASPRWGAVLLCAACTAPVAVRVNAAPHKDGVRVHFRRAQPGTGGHCARLEADGGTLEEVLHSPDRLTASVLWRGGSGTLRCTFPYGGVGEFPSHAVTHPADVDYVFLERDGMLVEGTLPRACPMLRVLRLRISLTPALLPAVLVFPGGERVRIEERETAVEFSLRVDGEGALVGGDHRLLLGKDGGKSVQFFITVDPDGTIAATSGYIRNW